MSLFSPKMMVNMVSKILTLHVAAALAAVPAAYPPVGSVVTFEPATRSSVSLRHCDYVCSVDPLEPGNEDFQFNVVAALNGNNNPAFVSFTSANFPDHYLSPLPTGKVGVNTNPDHNDATWQLVQAQGSNWTIVSQSQAFPGYVLSLATSTTNPCSDGPDVVLAPPGAPGIVAQSWIVGAPPPPPPPPPSPFTIAAGSTTGTLSDTILGCHSDEGFMHQPQFFLSNMIYGEAFEGTNGLKSGWSVLTDNGAQGSDALDYNQRFAAAQRPSMHVNFASGSGTVRLVHRGMGNEGLVVQGGKEYEGYFFARATAATTVTVALNDYTSSTPLASTTVNIPGTGVWTQLSFTLTPSASTTCTGITAGSDPNIDCNSGGFPDYVCIRCGGELSFGLSSPGDMWVGYARFEPGTWGRVPGVPVRIEAAEILQAMGIKALRYGGSVGSSVNWKDFRGPVWNRTGLGFTWAASDSSGWGPFDALDAFAALNISVAVTMAMTQQPDYYADLVEYCLGNESTTWGAQRVADGHPQPYAQPYAWEIGNEQYNPNFVQQVKAMEDKAAELGVQVGWYYMFPDNGGMNAQDQAAAVAAGLPITRIATDVHVGSAGGVQQIGTLFSKSYAPNFPASAINGEVNAIYGDGVNTASALGRALSEAADINDWFNADPAVLGRILARTASFCSERNGHDDGSQWHQGLTFFLPNMTWLGPAGQYHAILASTWAPGSLAVTGSQQYVSISAQKAADGSRVVVRMANNQQVPAVVVLTITGFNSNTNVKVTTLSGTALTQTNPPWDTLAIAPVVTYMNLPSGGGNVTLPAYAAVTLELLQA